MAFYFTCNFTTYEACVSTVIVTSCLIPSVFVVTIIEVQQAIVSHLSWLWDTIAIKSKGTIKKGDHVADRFILSFLIVTTFQGTTTASCTYYTFTATIRIKSLCIDSQPSGTSRWGGQNVGERRPGGSWESQGRLSSLLFPVPLKLPMLWNLPVQLHSE